MTTTLYTRGHYGWGDHTPDLVESVATVETGRGFRPPIFIDIRIRGSRWRPGSAALNAAGSVLIRL